MKKFLIAFVAVFTLLCSCSKDDGNKFDYPMDTLCGTWEGIAVKTDSEWIDITGSAFSRLQFSITFHSDGTYYGKGYFGTGGGTYKAFGKTIETYVDGELYYTYHVNSMTSNQAELTMSAKGSSLEIRVQKK
jgi:heat shock protein HslJ